MEDRNMKCYKKDYPRPQFVRDNWVNLSGTWDFGFDDANQGEKEKWYEKFPGELKIEVPFTYETKLSGIQDERRHDNIWYHKTITVDASKLTDNRLLIHFEGSDFHTKLWVNGAYAGDHKGGYARFSFDITELVKDGENELVVKVEDSFDTQQPRGKQRWIDENFGCWYVQTTGIWKTVWTEYVPKIRLDHVKMTPNLHDMALEIEYQLDVPESELNENLMVVATITFGDMLISKTMTVMTSDHMKTKVDVFHKTNSQANCSMEWGVRTWSPESPDLYDITFEVVADGKVLDTVGSYFAMREIRIDGSNILLNGHPLYQRLILDQGYWKDSHLTPPSEEALIEDIDKIHELGYNGLRKHQKTEDERFLYWCDVKGMLVWSEMAAAYEYSDKAVEEFTREWTEIVRQNYNHPCIITWTPVNESWGVSQVETDPMQQHFTEMLYHLTKSMDRYRPVIVNDGWEHTMLFSDIKHILNADTKFAWKINSRFYSHNQVTEYRRSIPLIKTWSSGNLDPDGMTKTMHIIFSISGIFNNFPGCSVYFTAWFSHLNGFAACLLCSADNLIYLSFFVICKFYCKHTRHIRSISIHSCSYIQHYKITWLYYGAIGAYMRHRCIHPNPRHMIIRISL